MKKFLCKHRRCFPCFAFIMFTAFFCWLFVLSHGVFGSKVDWISQHSVLPDYFRRMFYETGEFFPEFALHIGGGQNIYNFAYYGLYSPVVLPSYLLPFVKMADYMMAVQFLCLVASVLLFYYWLVKRGFSKSLSFGTALLFLLAGPMIYHSYNQIMFVNYMPFLCMGFLGVERYFERRGGLLTVSIFLMIMSSFYFSIGGMLVLILYGLHRYLEICEETRQNETLGKRILRFLKEGVRFSFPFITAVLMSAFLLVPTAMALTGRDGAGAKFDISTLFMPRFSLDEFFYSPYGMGLTTLAVTALIAMLFFRKLHERALAWGCLILLSVPVFAYLLNGGLYIRDKVMIPFLPLLCYILAYYLRDMEREGVRQTASGAWGWFCKGIKLLPYIVTLALIYAGRNRGDAGHWWMFIFLDGLLMMTGYIIFCISIERKYFPFLHEKAVLLMIPSIIFLLGYGYVMNTEADRAEDLEFYETVTDSEIENKLKQIADEEDGFYRMEQLGTDDENAANLNRIHDMGQYVSSIYSSSYNKEYLKFRRHTFQLEQPFRNFLMQSPAQNPVYQRFMGIKYVLTGDKVQVNENILPIAYASNRMISEETYKKLTFPYNQLVLLEASVVNHEVDRDSVSGNSQEEPVKIELPSEVDSRKNKSCKVKISGTGSGEQPEVQHKAADGSRVLFLQFDVKNKKPSQDIAIWVEGIRNKLTCKSHFYYNDNTTFTYAVPLSAGQEQIEIKFGKGKYELSNVKSFLAELPDSVFCQSEFQVDKEKTKGNIIAGKMNVKEQGYFITSIPYDEHFVVRIDGKEVRKEKVNTAFLGAEIEAGEYQVEIRYHAPGARLGKWLSIVGFVIFAGMLWFKKGRFQN